MFIHSIDHGSPAESAGLMAGDEVIAVNGGPARDDIDLMFYGDDEDVVTLTVRRSSREFIVEFELLDDAGIVFEPMTFRSCGNSCVFCFVDQNPAGMRDAVYFKDEDYRLSFLHGSYVTLTRLGDDDIQRITEQRLSPLYISVHAVDSAVRRKLLGVKHDDRLLEKIDRLIEAGVMLHCQVVVCPGINDGDFLVATLDALYERYPTIQSVAVVPVGITRHRQGLFPLQIVDGCAAARIIDSVDMIHARARDEQRSGFAYCADELYIRAGRQVPPGAYYDDFPQIENGVGMVRDFLDAVSGMGRRTSPGAYRRGRFVLVTGVSMSGYMHDFAARLSRLEGVDARVVTVVNGFYGETVTVSGLLTGGDIRGALDNVEPDETVVLPPNCLNDDGLFLDDMSPGELERDIRATVIQGGYDPLELFLNHDSGEW